MNLYAHIRPLTAIAFSAHTATLLSATAPVAASSEMYDMLEEGAMSNVAYYSSAPALLADTFDPTSLADLQQLLQSDSFRQNMSLALNISAANLTGLLNTAQLQNPNQTLDQLVPLHQPLSMSVLITLTVFYAFIFVAGVLGNLITCIVISRNKFMHTATNFYLFNLAVSDLILLLSGAPQDLYSFWYPNAFPFTDAMCIMDCVLAETAANATVLTITAFTVERYIAICHPFRQHTMSKLSRAIKFIFAIWVAALLLALPQAMQFSVVQDLGGTSCTIDNDFVAHVFAVSGFIFFGGPMTAICVLYVLIGIKLKRSRLLQTVPRRSYDVHRGISAQSRVIRMLVAVAVAFFLCWAPFHAQRLMAVYGSAGSIKSKLFRDVFNAVDYTSSVLYYLSTCINPLLYNIMSHKFRDAFKVTLARHFGFPGRYQSQSHNYSALLRQNGSMRLHTTDSIRTTTTTTTINSAGGSCIGNSGNGLGGANNASRRSSQRSRYVSISSQSPHTTSLARHDEHMGSGHHQLNGADINRATPKQQPHRHHKLQTQLSQHSTGSADANMLLDLELNSHRHSLTHQAHPHASHKPSRANTPVRRSIAAHTGIHHSNKLSRAASRASDAISTHSLEWERDNDGDDYAHSEFGAGNDADLPKPVSPNSLTMSAQSAPLPSSAVQTVHAIAELDVHTPPARTRLKLSRIISRRDQDALLAKSNARADVMRSNMLPLGADIGSPYTTYEAERRKQAAAAVAAHNSRPHHKTLDTLTGIFHWRARKKEGQRRHAAKHRQSDSTSSSAAAAPSSSSVGAPTPRVALMQTISTTSSATPVTMKESCLCADATVLGGGGVK